MAPFVPILIVLGVAFLLQIVASMLQIKYFTKEFVKLRKKGKVAIGRQGGGFFAGAIVMFLIDDEGIIQHGSKKMEGLTCFAKVKDYNDFEGRFVGELKAEDGPDKHKNLKRAIEDAANNYNTVMRGEKVPDKPSPYKKAGTFLARGFSGKKANKEYKEHNEKVDNKDNKELADTKEDNNIKEKKVNENQE